jgi:hypothetical protein
LDDLRWVRFPDVNAARTGVSFPDFYATRQSGTLISVIATWILQAELVEEFRGIYVRTPLQAPTEHLPHEVEGMRPGSERFRVHGLWSRYGAILLLNPRLVFLAIAP